MIRAASSCRRQPVRPVTAAGAATGAAILVLALAAAGAAHASAPGASGSAESMTTTPIKHVVVIIGENHTFDNVFATYRPTAGQQVRDLLSEGIVTKDGGAGPNYRKAVQFTARDTRSRPGHYSLTPPRTGRYSTLPVPNTTYASQACTGLPDNAPDTRFPTTLAGGPYQITKYVPYFDNHNQYSQYGQCEFYGAMVGDPLHRFYQMWQQTDGGSQRLWTWVANTAGDDNGARPPAPIYQGGLQMGYYNMAQGDAPIFDRLAHEFAMSDNYHQAVMGGTGANHIALGTGYAAYYQNSAGQPAAPPKNQIENPNPKPGTNNNYIQDGYAGGSYSECADPNAPGVGPIDAYLSRLPYKTFRNCKPGHYYLLNNYNPGYTVTGQRQTAPFTVPPQHHWPSIANELSAHGISWGYFGEGYNNGKPTSGYCGICDPFQYSASVMTNPRLRAHTQHDSSDFDTDVARGHLPAVSFLKPGDDDGHPGYSTLAAFENFVAHSVDEVMNSPLWKNTAIFVTFDEGGGYYDSGYIQPVSFFGDGTRVPMIVVSPYTRPGHIDHTYTDHVSILKFIEANWRLSPVSSYSEDNLPNPPANAYRPTNSPAIGNLMTAFNFAHPHFNAKLLRVRAMRRSAPQARPGINR